MKYVIRKWVSVMTAIMVMLTTVIPAQLAVASGQEVQTLGDTPVSFPGTFSPYTYTDGSSILDPAGEPGINPVDVDITSGVDKGLGNLPSVYMSSTADHLFVRLRVKGDPYDRKGGYLSCKRQIQHTYHNDWRHEKMKAS